MANTRSVPTLFATREQTQGRKRQWWRLFLHRWHLQPYGCENIWVGWVIHPTHTVLFSPCNMNLSASQHAMTPPGRKRLFVKVQAHYPGTPGNKMEDHSLPIQKGAWRWQVSKSRLLYARDSGVILWSSTYPEVLRIHFRSELIHLSIFYTLRAFAGNPKRKLPMLTFGLLIGWVIQQLRQFLQKWIPSHLNHSPLQRACQS